MRPTGIPQNGTNHPAIILIGISTMEMMDKKNDGDDGQIKKSIKQNKMYRKKKNKKGAEESPRMSEREKEQP